jgi:hypothetical protein
MTALVFLPYLIGATTAATLGVAIWSLKWPHAKGTIDVSIFEREETGFSGPDGAPRKRGKFYLAYSYSVAGVSFQGARIAPLVEIDWQFSSSPDLSSARDRAYWYREGATVDVSYCPIFPRWSCLEPGGFFVAFLLGAITAVLFFIV